MNIFYGSLGARKNTTQLAKISACIPDKVSKISIFPTPKHQTFFMTREGRGKWLSWVKHLFRAFMLSISHKNWKDIFMSKKCYGHANFFSVKNSKRVFISYSPQRHINQGKCYRKYYRNSAVLYKTWVNLIGSPVDFCLFKRTISLDF